MACLSSSGMRLLRALSTRSVLALPLTVRAVGSGSVGPVHDLIRLIERASQHHFPLCRSNRHQIYLLSAGARTNNNMAINATCNPIWRICNGSSKIYYQCNRIDYSMEEHLHEEDWAFITVGIAQIRIRLGNGKIVYYIRNTALQSIHWF